LPTSHLIDRNRGPSGRAFSLVPGSARRRIQRRLQRLIDRVRADPTFRRTLRYAPRQALAEHALPVEDAPAQLPVRHTQLDVLVSPASLFGLEEPEARGPVPLELRLLIYGARPAVLIPGPEQELVRLLRWAERSSLCALLSPGEWRSLPDTGKGGYSNRTGSVQRARAGSGASRMLVVSSDENRALLIWCCLALGWDGLLGRLLGYPGCCGDAFVERWAEAAESHQGDLAVPSLRASGSAPYGWRANNLARYLGWELIQHFPCRYDCEATQELGRIYERVLLRHEPQYAAELQRVLTWPVLYTEKDGVALLPFARVEEVDSGLRVHCDGRPVPVTDPAGELARALAAPAVIEAPAGGGGFRIGGRGFPGELVRFTADVDGARS
jgi:hypothetical protein